MNLARAIETGDLSALPSRRDEDWRWTDLAGQVREPVDLSPAIAGTIQRGGPFGLATEDNEVIVANGHLNFWPDPDVASSSLAVTTHQKPDLPRLIPHLPMARLAAKRAVDPPATIIELTGADALARLRFVSMSERTGHHARVGVVVRAGARAVLLESYEGEGEDYISNVLLEFIVEDGASLERVIVSNESASAISISTAEVKLATGATFAQTVLTTGAKRQRIETHVAHPGGGAHVRMDGSYLLSDRRHADITTEVEHLGRDGTTSQLVKGMAADQARAVFQGRIIVAKGSDGTDARMGHHALIASERAEVDAKPELLIFADDVQCAHGNTIGALDDEALFYIRQRGIPEAEARSLLTSAFVAEVIDRIGHEGARAIAAAWVAQRLETA